MTACREISELLYEYQTGRLAPDAEKNVAEHLRDCEKCRRTHEDLIETLGALNEWKPPEVPAGFGKRVMGEIAKESKNVPVSLLDRFIKPSRFRLPIQGLAVAAMVLLALTIYRNFVPEIDRMPRDFKVMTGLVEAKSPVIIETKDVGEAFDKLKELIQTHQGHLVRRKPVDSGMEVTFRVSQEKEEGFFKDINLLGKVKKEKEGYKEGDGNMVILLKKES